MSAKWFCKIMGDEQGPMSSAQLQEIARSGHLGIDDLVRKDGHSMWVRAENVVGLFHQPSLPVVVHESIAVIDDATVRATWGATASVSEGNGSKCSIEVNATTLSGCNLSSTTTGGTTNQSSRDSAARIASVIVPRRTMKMTVKVPTEPQTRNFGNRTTRAMNFDSQADTLPCVEAARSKAERPEDHQPKVDHQKTVQSVPQLPRAKEQLGESKLGDQRAQIVERFFEVWRQDAGEPAGAVALAEQH